MTADLDSAFREASGRVIAALAARRRDLDLAEDAFAEACTRAAALWPVQGAPRDPAAWLFRVADRCALDALRRRRTRERLPPDPPAPEATIEDIMADEARLIPDERLRLIFVCCHPAVGADARAALTLRLVCGLPTAEIASAFLISEAALAQRLVRAKRKIAAAGVPFEVPAPDRWPERMDAVLSTLEIAYAKAHADAAGAGPHARYAAEVLALTAVLTQLAPAEAGALALAATVRFAEARRTARLDEAGVMVPLSDQDPVLWRRPLIEAGQAFLRRALALDRHGPRVLQAAIHGAWCGRETLAEPPPWPAVLDLYDRLLLVRDDVIVRLNRAVVVGELAGPGAALAELETLEAPGLVDFPPYHAVRADVLRRLGRDAEARAAYDVALALGPAPAERAFLEGRRALLAS